MLIGAAGGAELLPPPQGMVPQSCRVLGGHDLVQTLQTGDPGGLGLLTGCCGHEGSGESGLGEPGSGDTELGLRAVW